MNMVEQMNTAQINTDQESPIDQLCQLYQLLMGSISGQDQLEQPKSTQGYRQGNIQIWRISQNHTYMCWWHRWV